MRNINDLVRMPERQPENVGFAYFDWTEDEGTPFVRRAIIAEGPWSLVAYVGVPENHELAGDDEGFPLDVHGGLTYAGSEGDGPRPQGWYFYGWDYGHAGDWRKPPAALAHLYPSRKPSQHDWTLEEVWAETKEAMIQLGNLMRKGP